MGGSGFCLYFGKKFRYFAKMSGTAVEVGLCLSLSPSVPTISRIFARLFENRFEQVLVEESMMVMTVFVLACDIPISANDL